MSRHLEKPDNATFLQYAGKTGAQKLKKILATGWLTLACPCCRKQFPRSVCTTDFKQHIKTAKNNACLKAASKSKDPVVFEIYNNTLRKGDAIISPLAVRRQQNREGGRVDGREGEGEGGKEGGGEGEGEGESLVNSRR